MAADDAPAAFLCPILYEVMRDPVITARKMPLCGSAASQTADILRAA